ncbi:ankyrin repeat-containing domain protein [Morchella snyderi]|nr:ankyrin repeat-containing domain protein [Morchella snyderi]
MLPNPPAHLQAEATISCLQHAVTAGRFDLLQLLIIGGADLNKTITEDGLNHKTGTCLHWLASCGLGTSVRCRAPLPMIKIFCDSGADLDEKDDNRQTVLHYFAISGARNVTTLLGPDDFTTDGIAWIYEAVLQKHIDSGANINVQNTSGKTPLHLAAIDDEEMMVKILLKASVIAVIEDRDGTTANKLSTLSMKHMIYSTRYQKSS